jgi:hypothetical protein
MDAILTPKLRRSQPLDQDSALHLATVTVEAIKTSLERTFRRAAPVETVWGSPEAPLSGIVVLPPSSRPWLRDPLLQQRFASEPPGEP